MALAPTRDGVVPATVNVRDQAEERDLDYTLRQPRRQRIEHGLKLPRGFGGHLAAVAAQSL